MQSVDRWSFRRLAVFAALFALWTGPTVARHAAPAAPDRADAATVAHVLNRIGFGARPGDIGRAQAMGLSAYIEQQLHPERLADEAVRARLADFATLEMSSRDLADEYFIPAQQAQRALQQQQARQAQAGGDMTMTPPPDMRPQATPEQRRAQQGAAAVVNELMQAKLLRATMSERQLEEVLVDFWFNHFNVFVGKGQVRNYLTEYEREAIRPHVFGRFRDMLGATAKSPAMLFYLDNFQSQTPDPPTIVSPEMERRLRDPRLTPQQRRQIEQQLLQARNRMQPQQQRQPRGLNENYARELMELHTLGVDGGYTQQDVIEVARILTGWTIDRPQQGGGFIFRPVMHDTGTKVVLGRTFQPDGQNEGERLLDLLATHPSTAKHIAFKLAQRFVADEPPAALVDRAAKRFLDTGGDLREVTRTLITSPEFLSEDYRRAKVKTPLEFVVSAARAADATVVNAQPMVQALRELGMPLYGCQPPTGYSMTADAWVNTGALLNRMNFALALVNGGQPVRPNQDVGTAAGRPGPGGRGGQGVRLLQLAAARRGPIQVDLASLAPDLSDETRDRLVDTMLAGHASESTRQTMARAETPQQLVALTLGSPEFQRR